jgi:hypothetical protein
MEEAIEIGKLVEIVSEGPFIGLRLSVVDHIVQGNKMVMLLSYNEASYEDEYAKPLSFYPHELKVINGC